MINFLHGLDPVKVELNRMENEVRGEFWIRWWWWWGGQFSICWFFLFVFVCADKDRELGEALAEIKALRLTKRLREKAVEEVLSQSFVKFEFKI